MEEWQEKARANSHKATGASHSLGQETTEESQIF